MLGFLYWYQEKQRLKKQQDLKEAVRNETLAKIREEQQLEIYKAKGKQLELESVSLTKRIDIEV